MLQFYFITVIICLFEYFVSAVFSSELALFIMARFRWQAVLYFLDASFANPMARMVRSGA
jgi:hypothetical protein